MNELQARQWLINELTVSRETIEKLEAFAAFLKIEATKQNLISKATFSHIWARHIIDSAQLQKFAPNSVSWLDLGSGAGFPGLIAAIIGGHKVTLVESRTKRIEYLKRAIEYLGLQDRATVAGMALERLETAPYSVISARAFAPLPRLLSLSARFSTANTLWLLPKGQNAAKELSEAVKHWNLDFAIEDSVTDKNAGILIGQVIGEKPHRAVKGWHKQ
ncbi:MAG: 16S rRNA (guanine(527)-N(7))-methyltransferase RsmG [Sphingorhabdus sp.]